jgi:hypothetical protein
MIKSVLTLFFGLAATFVFAQKTTLLGMVNDKEGKPVPFAFIKDANHNYATFSDPSGAFTLKVDTADRLLITAFNFKETVVKVGDPQNISVVLANDDIKTNKAATSNESFKEKLSTEGIARADAGATGYIAKENSVHGSRYLFDDWVHGFVITNADTIKQSDTYLFNYQKMDNSLVFTDGGDAMKEIPKGSIKKFVLFDEKAQPYAFVDVPAIDPKHYVQVLAAGSKYALYKQLNTKYFPNDYVSNGMTSSGHNYDEFKDEPEYYVVKQPGGQPQKILFKNKSIKAVFADDIAKVNKYLSDHDADLDENYLADLVSYLNN